MNLNRIIKTVNYFYSQATEYDLASKMLERGEIITLTSPITVSHRSSNLNLSKEDLDPLAIRETRQGKRKSSPMVGLYTYGPEDDVPRYGENKIEIELPTGTTILDTTKIKELFTSRISKSVADKLIDAGIDVIKGKDFIGPPEYIILKMPR